MSAGDEAAVEGDAGDDRETAGARAHDGGQFLHEREEEVDGQVEGRGPEGGQRPADAPADVARHGAGRRRPGRRSGQ